MKQKFSDKETFPLTKYRREEMEATNKSNENRKRKEKERSDEEEKKQRKMPCRNARFV